MRFMDVCLITWLTLLTSWILKVQEEFADLAATVDRWSKVLQDIAQRVI